MWRDSGDRGKTPEPEQLGDPIRGAVASHFADRAILLGRGIWEIKMRETLTAKVDDRWRLKSATANAHAYAQVFDGEEILLVGASPETIIISKSDEVDTNATIEIPRAVMSWVMFQCELAAGKIRIVAEGE